MADRAPGDSLINCHQLFPLTAKGKLNINEKPYQVLVDIGATLCFKPHSPQILQIELWKNWEKSAKGENSYQSVLPDICSAWLVKKGEVSPCPSLPNLDPLVIDPFFPGNFALIVSFCVQLGLGTIRPGVSKIWPDRNVSCPSFLVRVLPTIANFQRNCLHLSFFGLSLGIALDLGRVASFVPSVQGAVQ